MDKREQGEGGHRLVRGEPLGTPVLLLIFNRPEHTQKVFEELRKARPAELYVSADGPREGVAGEAERCQAARDVIKQVDWDCKVYTNFREENVGLKVAVSSGIDWFFEHVEEGIILEDDCVPSQSFFWFCQELLARYRDDERIMQISGNNFLAGTPATGVSYYFSRLNDVWGWATWRRAWRLYDRAMETYPQFKREGRIRDYVEDPEIAEWLMSYFDEAHNARDGRGIWSSQWAYAICAQNGLTIAPSINLVANIGILGDGTHAGESFRFYAGVERLEMEELIHPPFILPDKRADALRFEVIRKTDPRLLPGGGRMRSVARRFIPPRYRRAIKDLARRFGSKVLRG